ncbi:MAG: hypothetical protein LBH17_07415 [Oscillospiraceae bacterium]|jgi:uncharacterized membrane protein|nr:hypothetical protein [Oscillospiraceae bacterium]
MMNKTLSAYIDAVCNQIKNRQLREETRRELKTQLQSRFAEAQRRGADEETAAREAVSSMRDPVELGKIISIENRRHTGLLPIVLMALATVGFFILMGFISHWQMTISIVDLLIELAIAFVIASVLSARRFSPAKFLTNIQLGAALAGVIYPTYIMVASVAGTETASQVRNNVAGIIVNIAYGLILFAIFNTIERLAGPSSKSFVKGVIRDRLGFNRLAEQTDALIASEMYSKQAKQI